MRLALHLLLLVGCAGSPSSAITPARTPATTRSELAALQLSMASHAEGLDAESTKLGDVEVQQADDRQRMDELDEAVHSLNSLWHEVITDYRAAVSTYDSAAKIFDATRVTASEASATYVEARDEWKRAAVAWRFAAVMIAAATALETQRLNNSSLPRTARQTDLACDQGMSTRSFRHARGVSSGNDVDHIVPLSLGGADHPLNYRVISAHVNRSLGNRFDASKCASTGALACALAVAISTKCGGYHGGIPSN